MNKSSFAPLINSHCQLLILGTLPGEQSLQRQQYYAHPRNQFWRLLGDILNIPLAEKPYPLRCQILLQHHVALWDTVASAKRHGSLDSHIKQANYNDIAKLIHAYPTIRAIAFNGQQARKFFNPQEKAITTALSYYDLPSSSPAYTLTYEKKYQCWLAVFQKILRLSKPR